MDRGGALLGLVGVGFACPSQPAGNDVKRRSK